MTNLNIKTKIISVKKLLKPILGVVFAIIFIVLIFNKVNFSDVGKASVGVSWSWLFMALLMFGVGYSLRIQRWKKMLQVDNPAILWSDCAGPLLASFAMNNVLPFRLGDIARAFAFNKKLGVNSGGVLATLLVERLFDLLMVLFFLLVALYFFQVNTLSIFGVGVIALLVLLVVIVLTLNFPRLFFPIVIYFCNLITKLYPSVGSALTKFLRNIFLVLDRLSRGEMMMILTFWSFVIWTAEGCVFWFIAIGLPSISDSSAAWLALPVGTLATLIPSTPGYVGTFDYFVIQSMHFLGNSLAGSAAFAFIVHALLWLPPTITGGLYLAINTVSLKDLKSVNNG